MAKPEQQESLQEHLFADDASHSSGQPQPQREQDEQKTRSFQREMPRDTGRLGHKVDPIVLELKQSCIKLKGYTLRMKTLQIPRPGTHPQPPFRALPQ